MWGLRYLIQYAPDCPKHKNHAPYGVKIFALSSSTNEVARREIREPDGGIGGEGVVSENPEWRLKRDFFIEEGRNYQAIKGPGAWLKEQERIAKGLGSNLKLETIDICTICHLRPVRRKSDGKYPTLRACQECADAR